MNQGLRRDIQYPTFHWAFIGTPLIRSFDMDFGIPHPSTLNGFRVTYLDQFHTRLVGLIKHVET